MENILHHAEQTVASRRETLTQISDQIWEYAETKFEEFRSSKLLCDVLEKEGFAVEKGIGNIPTAFKGIFGTGKPVIGFLGEFDALARLSQKSGCTQKVPDDHGNSNGHGCGHHLLGTGALGAAIVVKEYLKANQMPGTVIYYGCPAEEGASGKAWMVREHCFDEADVIFAWHPSNMNCVGLNEMLATIQLQFHFHGTAAHASASPHLGRSALDAVELMNVGANFLREHIIQEARIHYAITDAGGNFANVVQPEATVLYQMRAPKMAMLRDIAERVKDIAKGAALMTGTTVDVQFDRSCSEFCGNPALNKVLYESFADLGVSEVSEEDKAFAREMRRTLSPQMLGEDERNFVGDYGEEDKELLGQIHDKELLDVLYPKNGRVGHYTASSDVGDVSQIKPTCHLYVSCFAKDLPAHSWQLVSSGKMPYAHKGMLQAAKVMGLSALRVLTDQELLEQAKEDFKRQEEQNPYIQVIPEDAKPPIPSGALSFKL